MLDIQSEANKQSRRVASWIYEVINVVLESVPIEKSFLDAGNTTWRFYSRELEHIRPIRRYLTPAGRHICVDLTRAIPITGKRFDDHDSLLGPLASAAGAAHDAVMAQPGFVDAVRDALARHRADGQEGAPGPVGPAGAFGDDKLPQLVAEHVVNRIRDLPSHHTDSAFWARFRDRFIEYARGEPFERLRQCVDQTAAVARELLTWLEDTRFELCERFDVPAAPADVYY